MCCSRRAGKTQVVARLIAISLLSSGRNEWTLFAAGTLGIAKNLIWAELVAINDRHKLQWKMVELEGAITTPTGARFRCIGVDDRKQIEKLRGPKYRLIVLDEASTYQDKLKRLINDAVRPALMDLRGSLIIAGTPGYVCAGDWFEIATGKRHYRVFSWTLRENPHMPDPEAELAAIRAENKWTENEPTYRREYLGLWINDADSLVFGGYVPDRNKVQAPPFDPNRWVCTVGVDFGTKKDPSAIVVIGTPKGEEKDRTYALFAKRYPGLLPDEMAVELRDIVTTFQPTAAVGDSGGLGAPYVEEWNRRHAVDAGITVEAAAKTDSLASYELMDSAFRSEHLFITEGAQELEDEVLYLPWYDSHRRKVHPQYANHCSDGCRYAYKKHAGYAYKAVPEPEFKHPPKWSTAEQRKERNRRKQAALSEWE